MTTRISRVMPVATYRERDQDTPKALGGFEFMSKPSQSVELKDLGYRKEIEAWIFGKKPSWKTYGEGSAQIRVSLEKDGGIYIIASEHSFGGESKRTVSKEVFVTLPPEGAKLLKQLLNERTDI